MPSLRQNRPRPGRSAGGFDLQEGRLSKAYRARLVQAATVLSAWATESGVCLVSCSSDPSLMSEILIRFVQDLFEAGAAVWLGTHAILSCQTRWRHLKNRLRGAWDSIASWNQLKPVRSRTPLPAVLLEAIVRFSVFAAVALEPWKAVIWWPFGVAMMTAFHGLLRPGELWKLRRCDVRVPGTRSLLAAPIVVLTIREPKNRHFAGRLQVRSIREPEVISWISWLLEGAPPETLLWPHGPRTFRLCLEQALRFFGLAHLSLTPASLRAGGATHLFEVGASISAIRFAGSWSSERVLSHYLQEAEAAATLLDVDEATARFVHTFVRTLGFAAKPPEHQWKDIVRTWTSQRFNGRLPFSAT
jgi:hypothetical protein